MGFLYITHPIDSETKPVATVITPDGLHTIVTTDLIGELISEGEQFVATAYTAVLGIAASVDYRVAVGDVDGIHLGANYMIGADGAVYIYRDTTHNAGAALTEFNRNQNEDDGCANIAINVSAGGGADGTLIFNAAIPGGSKVNSSPGGGRSAVFGWILEANTVYLFRLTNISGGATIASIQFDWHSHDGG